MNNDILEYPYCIEIEYTHINLYSRIGKVSTL